MQSQSVDEAANHFSFFFFFFFLRIRDQRYDTEISTTYTPRTWLWLVRMHCDLTWNGDALQNSGWGL